MKRLVSMLLLAGCSAPCDTMLPDQLGERSFRVAPAYVAEYGCDRFARMTSTLDLIAFCVEVTGDPDASVAADVVDGCRPGESDGGCQLFWICEGGP